MADLDAYPLPRPDDESRFTYGLTSEVADVLVRHGYPALTSDDFVRLQQTLFWFIYARPEESQ